MVSRTAVALVALVLLSTGIAVEDRALAATLRRLAAESPGTVGVSVVHIESGAFADVNPAGRFPMMSVYKLPIVIHALRLSERQRLDLSERVTLVAQDRRPGASAMGQAIAAGGTPSQGGWVLRAHATRCAC